MSTHQSNILGCLFPRCVHCAFVSFLLPICHRPAPRRTRTMNKTVFLRETNHVIGRQILPITENTSRCTGHLTQLDQTVVGAQKKQMGIPGRAMKSFMTQQLWASVEGKRKLAEQGRRGSRLEHSVFLGYGIYVQLWGFVQQHFKKEIIHLGPSHCLSLLPQ